MAENRMARRGDPRSRLRAPSLPAALFTAGVLGAVVLAASQFMTLFRTHIQASRIPVASATVGSEHAYALLPVAAVTVFLAYGVWSVVSRPALLGLGALGLVALLISLLHDLHYARKSGLRTLHGHYVLAANTPSIGLYAETLGGMILLIACVSGFILLGPPRRRAAPLSAPHPTQSSP